MQQTLPADLTVIFVRPFEQIGPWWPLQKVTLQDDVRNPTVIFRYTAGVLLNRPQTGNTMFIISPHGNISNEFTKQSWHVAPLPYLHSSSSLAWSSVWRSGVEFTFFFLFKESGKPFLFTLSVFLGLEPVWRTIEQSKGARRQITYLIKMVRQSTGLYR